MIKRTADVQGDDWGECCFHMLGTNVEDDIVGALFGKVFLPEIKLVIMERNGVKMCENSGEDTFCEDFG